MQHDIESAIAYLPDGQEVRIEGIDSVESALVRRVGGRRDGSLAVCALSKLKRDLWQCKPEESSDPSNVIRNV